MTRRVELMLMLALFVASLCATSRASGGEARAVDVADAQAKVQESQRIRDEISLLNLLRGLYLSLDQLDRLIVLADRAAAIRQEAAVAFAAKANTYLADLAALRDALYSTTGPTQEHNTRASRGHHELETGPRYKVMEEIVKVEDEARKVLNEAQIAVIEGFSPCLIPPKNLSDPIAVGQAQTTVREEAFLDLVRRMPDSLYQQRRLLLADALVARGEREKGKVSADARRGLVSAYGKKLDEVRRMTAVDYDLKKKDIAKSFQMYEEKNYSHGYRMPGAVARYLLSAEAAQVMRRWREERAKDPPETEWQPKLSSDPAERARNLAQWAAGRVMATATTLVGERAKMGKLSEIERAQALKMLSEARNAPPDKQYAEAARIVDFCNARAITKASVDAVQAKIGYLAVERRVPGVLRGLAAQDPLFDDPTGLGERVAESRKQLEAGKIEEAYATLVRVADYLQQFRD